jgi:F420H(2)-dependent quinone reductase
MSDARATDRLWPVLAQLTRIHALLYRASRGRIGGRMGNLPLLLLEHTGARSGAKRTTPLGYVTDGERLVLVASKGGHPRNPAWVHNLRAHPEVVVQVGGERRRVHAREASEAERERLWALALSAYRGYGSYQERTSRRIPLVVLEPRDGT